MTSSDKSFVIVGCSWALVFLIVVSSIFLNSNKSLEYNREIKLEAIEAMKDNVELKLDFKDLQGILK